MNKVIKLVFAYILCLGIILSVLPMNGVMAEDTKLSDEIKILTGLNIISGYTPESYIVKKSITYKEYLESILSLRIDGLISDLPAVAEQNGLIDNAAEIREGDSVEYEHAVEIAARLLGYGVVVEYTGVSYIKAATDAGILDNVVRPTGKKLDSDAMIKMLYNMLDAKMVEAELSTASKYVMAEKNVLEKYREIYHSSGMITANEFTSIYAPGGQKNTIEINNTLYYTEDNSMNELLGKNVDYWYKNGSFNIELVFATEKRGKNEELVIDGFEYVNVNSSYTSISYNDLKNSRARTAKLEGQSKIKVIKNSVAYANYTTSTFNVGDGSIRLLDSDGNGAYDIIFITDYELIMVDSCNPATNTIFNRYKGGGTGKIDLKDYEIGENLFVISDRGTEMTMSDIPIGSVVQMEKSDVTNAPFARLVVSTKESVSGVVRKYDVTEKIVTIDETDYQINDSYLQTIAAGHEKAPELRAQYTFYLDINGRVAGKEKLSEGSSYDYAMIYKVSTNSDEEIQIRYINAKNEHLRVNLHQKCKVQQSDGTYQDATDTNVTAVRAAGNIVKLRYASDGTVRFIDIPKANTASTIYKDDFNYSSEPNIHFRAGVGTTTFEGKYYLKDGYVIFATYDSTSTNPEDYKVISVSKGYFNFDGQDCNVDFYNVDEYRYAEMLKLTIQKDNKTTYMLVDKKTSTINADDEVLHTLTGVCGSLLNFSIHTDNQAVLNPVKSGDFVKLTVDYKGYITNVDVLYSPSGPDYIVRKLVVPNNGLYSEYFYHSCQFYGEVKDVDAVGKRILMETEEGGVPMKKTLNTKYLTPTVLVYDGNVNVGTIEDIEIGDMIIVLTSLDVPQTIAVYKKN